MSWNDTVAVTIDEDDGEPKTVWLTFAEFKDVVKHFNKVNEQVNKLQHERWWNS